MSRDVYTVDENTTSSKVLSTMATKNIGSVLITREGKLTGIFTERDLLKLFKDNQNMAFSSLAIKELMTPDPVTVKPSDHLAIVEDIFQRYNYRHFPVVNDQTVVGIISLKDLTNAKLNNLYKFIMVNNDHLKRVDDLINSQENRSILLVEPSRSITEYVRTTLENERFNVTAVSRGEEALKAAAAHEFISVITSFELADMNGVELARRFRNLETYKETPIVAISSNDSHKKQLKAIDQGIDEIIFKKDIAVLLVAKINAKIRWLITRQLQTSKRNLEVLRSLIVTYNHEFNNVAALMLGQLEIQKKAYLAQGAAPDFDRFIKMASKLKEITNSLNELREVNETSYSKSTKMINIQPDSE